MDQKQKNSEPYSLNYLYYGFYFLIFAGLQIFHAFLIDLPAGLDRIVYVFYAAGQAFIEVLCMAAVSSILLRNRYKRTHRIFILFLGILLFCRVMDFLLVRLMDISVWHGMEFFFREKPENMLEMLLATTIRPAVWAFSFLAVIALIFSGWGIFKTAQKIYQKRPLLCSGKTLIGLFALSFSLLAVSDVSLHFFQLPQSSFKYTKALPWKRTLFMPTENTMGMGSYLKNSQDVFDYNRLDSSFFSLERKPDIFLFIVESLREDFLTKEVTPAIAGFRENNTSFKQTLSTSNATHTSWFSLFYSTHPFYWKKYESADWEGGSPALSLLKKMGYKIHVYSASRLNFYSMKTVLFGKNLQNVDSIQEFQIDTSVASEADGAAIHKLCADLSSSDSKGGRLFITFLDSTHFDYSWPEKTHTIFTPIEEKVNYLKISYQRDNLDKIGNRYKNALRYVDDLFKTFETVAEENGLWEDSAVVFTADHGEELNEYGCMFHASNLSLPQIQVPLYMKLSSSDSFKPLQKEHKASQIDIFPTLFHYIVGENNTDSLFRGKSLFTEEACPYVIGARYNGVLSPYQFYVQSGNYRMIAEFCNREDIFHSDTIKILSIENETEKNIPFSKELVHTHFQEALNALFDEPSR